MLIGKRNDVSIKTKNESPNRMVVQSEDSSYFFQWLSIHWLLIVPIITVKPLYDVMGSYTSRNSD